MPKRGAGQTRTILIIEHDESVDDGVLLESARAAYYATGTLNPNRSRIELVSLSNMDTDVLNETLAVYQQRLDEAHRQLDTLKTRAQDDGVEWITLTNLAERLQVSYTTVWRAHREGRLKTKIVGGHAKDQLLCDPATYRPKKAQDE